MLCLNLQPIVHMWKGYFLALSFAAEFSRRCDLVFQSKKQHLFSLQTYTPGRASVGCRKKANSVAFSETNSQKKGQFHRNFLGKFC